MLWNQWEPLEVYLQDALIEILVGNGIRPTALDPAAAGRVVFINAGGVPSAFPVADFASAACATAAGELLRKLNGEYGLPLAIEEDVLKGAPG